MAGELPKSELSSSLLATTTGLRFGIAPVALVLLKTGSDLGVGLNGGLSSKRFTRFGTVCSTICFGGPGFGYSSTGFLVLGGSFVEIVVAGETELLGVFDWTLSTISDMKDLNSSSLKRLTGMRFVWLGLISASFGVWVETASSKSRGGCWAGLLLLELSDAVDTIGRRLDGFLKAGEDVGDDDVDGGSSLGGDCRSAANMSLSCGFL